MSAEINATTNGYGYANGPVTKAPAWHGLVAWDLLFNNLTTGLFLVAALSELAAPTVFTRVAKVAYPVALVFLLTDLMCLVLDLGDPWRFHHMLRVFKPSSPMSLGTWCLTIYSLPLTVAAALSLLPEGGMTLEWVRRTAVVLGLLPALGSAAYKGVLLSTNAQPGWRDARWLGGYLTNSALLLGCAELLALSVLTGETRATATLRAALGLLLVLNVIPLGLLLANLRPVLTRSYTREQLWRFGILALGGGTMIPLGLVLVGGSTPLMLGAVLFLLLGSLVIRFLIIKIPHAFP
ncbi:MAG TPA: NrfD/PsrC family molybdoenzyme membrane anchor subunit [Gemmataceae bacterium]|jgi:Ni/Fe-hydrogenase subunit HybB-like protein|nr:NrfD/PsrC family molybdoenzyme membrane anchor subunit [Gemmataceae bacterium]